MDTTNRSTEPTTSTSTSLVNVVSVWTSAVRRDTSSPERGLLEERHRQRLELVVRRDAQVAQEPLAGPRAAEHDHALEHRAHDDESDEQHDDQVDRVHVVSARSRGRSRASRAAARPARRPSRRSSPGPPARSTAAAAAESDRWRPSCSSLLLGEREQLAVAGGAREQLRVRRPARRRGRPRRRRPGRRGRSSPAGERSRASSGPPSPRPAPSGSRAPSSRRPPRSRRRGSAPAGR